MTDWPQVLVIMSLGLLMVNVFRFNVFICLAAISVNIALALQPGAPQYLLVGAWLLAAGEGFALGAKLALGNSKKARKNRFVG